MSHRASPSELLPIANRARRRIVEMSKEGHAPHLGSSLSCVDILVAAYHAFLRVNPSQPSHRLRDRFILSKGHAISALYAVLAERGFFRQNF